MASYLTDDARAVIYRDLLASRKIKDTAAELGIGTATVERERARIRQRWQQNLADLDREFATALGLYEHVESQALLRRQLRTALEARNARVRLLGLARPEKQEVAVSGTTATEITVRIVAPEPEPENSGG